jgi:hypothetical protein
VKREPVVRIDEDALDGAPVNDMKEDHSAGRLRDLTVSDRDVRRDPAPQGVGTV